MQERILITGGCGFIGSHLVNELLRRGTDPQNIVVIDNLSTGKIENLPESVPFRRMDICHYTIVELCDLLRQCNIQKVYHLAAKARVQPSYTIPFDYLFDNVTGTTKLLEACRLSGVNDIIFASSSTAGYINSKNGSSPYGYSKAICEDICKLYRDQYKMNVVSLRYFSVYGGNMDMSKSNSTVLARILRSLVSEYEPFELYGTGKNARDFTYVGDVVNGTISAMEKIKDIPFHCYEFGCTMPIALNSILKLIPDLLIERKPAVKEIPITMSASGSANQDFGYEYRVHVIDWFKEQLKNLDYWKQRLILYEN